MKAFFDNSISFDDMVAKTIFSPEFAEAWEALKGSGIGSVESTKRVADLIRGSDWHLARLSEQQAEIMQALADSEIADTEFVENRVMAELLIAATTYMIMGIMLGVAFTLRRLAQDVVEEEEEKPVVN